MIRITTSSPIENLEELKQGIIFALLASTEGMDAESLFIEQRKSTNNQYFIDTTFGLKKDSYEIIKKLTAEFRTEVGYETYYRVYYELELRLHQIIKEYPQLKQFDISSEKLNEIVEEIKEDISSGDLSGEFHHYFYKHNMFENDDDEEDEYEMNKAMTIAYDDSLYEDVEGKIIEILQEHFEVGI